MFVRVDPAVAVELVATESEKSFAVLDDEQLRCVVGGMTGPTGGWNFAEIDGGPVGGW